MNLITELTAKHFVPRQTYVDCRAELLRLEELRNAMREPKGFFAKWIYRWAASKVDAQVEVFKLLVDSGLEAYGVVAGGVKDYVFEHILPTDLEGVDHEITKA